MASRAKGGDHQALDRLASELEAMAGNMARRVRAMSARREAREDAAQEAVIAGLAAVKTWDPCKGPFRPYAARVMRFRVLDHGQSVEKRERRVVFAPVPDLADLAAPVEQRFDAAGAASDLAAAVVDLWQRSCEHDFLGLIPVRALQGGPRWGHAALAYRVLSRSRMQPPLPCFARLDGGDLSKAAALAGLVAEAGIAAVVGRAHGTSTAVVAKVVGATAAEARALLHIAERSLVPYLTGEAKS